MAGQVVSAGALSHSPLANHQEPAEDVDAVARYRAAVAELCATIQASAPEAIVIFGPDHFRSLFYDNMPAFMVSVGRTRAFGDWGTKAQDLPVHQPLARHILRHLLNCGFDPAHSHDLTVDHGVSQAVELLQLEPVPIVPIVINAAAPPLPTAQRCFDLGVAVASAIASYPTSLRVAVVGSGGLSHTVPIQLLDESNATEAQIAMLIHGKASALENEPMREEKLLAGIHEYANGINPVWDRALLERFATGDAERAARELDEESILRLGGNGAQEIRTWFATAAAAGGGSFRTLAYEAIPYYITGMGVISSK